MAVLLASCKFTTSSFCETALRASASGSMTGSPSKVLTGVSSTSDRAISRSESGTDRPCSHFDTVCRTTFSLMASSCCDSPFDFLIAMMFSLNIGAHRLSTLPPLQAPLQAKTPVAASNAFLHSSKKGRTPFHAKRPRFQRSRAVSGRCRPQGARPQEGAEGAARPEAPAGAPAKAPRC